MAVAKHRIVRNVRQNKFKISFFYEQMEIDKLQTNL